MRWFKHKTDSWEDEKIANLRTENGLELYGFYWRVLEIIAKQMDKTDKTNCEYNLKVWSNFCDVSIKKFIKFAKTLEEKKLIILENGDNSINISVPNLLKYRDEYSRKEAGKSG